MYFRGVLGRYEAAVRKGRHQLRDVVSGPDLVYIRNNLAWIESRVGKKLNEWKP
jgi:hypothetical protein